MAVKEALDTPATTETTPGTVIAGLELESAIEADAIAALFRVTVQFVDPAEAIAAAEQDKEAIWTEAEIVSETD